MATLVNTMKGSTEVLTDIQNVRESNCHESFARLMDEHMDMVRRVVFRIVLNEHDTDDVVQETFIKAFQKINTFKGNAAFSTWLCRIACNQAYSLIRKRKESGVDADILASFPAPENLNADAAIHSKETHGAVTMALGRLPDDMRAAITLTALEGKSVKDAAYILDCNLMTFYWRLKQARKKLSIELDHLMN